MKQMNARYAGVCAYYDLSGCNRTIAVGDTIMWERGSGAWHVNCGPNARTETAEEVSTNWEVAQGQADAKTWQFLKGAFGENSRELIEWEISNDPESVGGPFY
jgi:hypothetical protein